MDTEWWISLGAFAVFPWELEFCNSNPVKMWGTEGLVTSWLKQWSVGQHGICTTYIKRLGMSISHKFFHRNAADYHFISWNTNKIVLTFQAWVFVSVLRCVTAQEGTTQNDSLLLKNMAICVGKDNSLYTRLNDVPSGIAGCFCAKGK